MQKQGNNNEYSNCNDFFKVQTNTTSQPNPLTINQKHPQIAIAIASWKP